jgi:hypothetical protein
MNKIILFFVFAVSAFGTRLFGTLNLPNAAGINGTLSLTLSQQASLNAGACGGPVLVVPTTAVSIPIAAGTIQGMPSVYGNDCMLPANLFYNVLLRDQQGNTLFTDRWVLVGDAVDIGTIVSAIITGTTTTLGTTGLVVLKPTTSQLVVQPAGTFLDANALKASNTFTFPDGKVCTTTGCPDLSGGGSTTPDVSTYGAICDGNPVNAVANTKAFNDAQTAIQTGTIVVSKGICVVNSFTVQPNIVLRYNGSLEVSAGQTVTYFGGIDAASSQRIFTGAGAIALQTNAGNNEVFAKWFAGSDCGAQINSAYASLPPQGGRIKVLAGCTQTTGIVFRSAGKSVDLLCMGRATQFDYTGTGAAITVDIGAFPAHIENCHFSGPGGASATTGLALGGTLGQDFFTMSRFLISGFGTGILTGAAVNEIKFTEGIIRANGQHINMVNVVHTVFDTVNFQAATTNANSVRFDNGYISFVNTTFRSSQVVLGTGGRVTAAFIGGMFASAANDADIPLMTSTAGGHVIRMTDVSIEHGRNAASVTTFNFGGGVVTLTGVSAWSANPTAAAFTLAGSASANLYGFTDVSGGGSFTGLFNNTGTGVLTSFPGVNAGQPNSKFPNRLSSANPQIGGSGFILGNDVQAPNLLARGGGVFVQDTGGTTLGYIQAGTGTFVGHEYYVMSVPQVIDPSGYFVGPGINSTGSLSVSGNINAGLDIVAGRSVGAGYGDASLNGAYYHSNAVVIDTGRQFVGAGGVNTTGNVSGLHFLVAGNLAMSAGTMAYWTGGTPLAPGESTLMRPYAGAIQVQATPGGAVGSFWTGALFSNGMNLASNTAAVIDSNGVFVSAAGVSTTGRITGNDVYATQSFAAVNGGYYFGAANDTAFLRFAEGQVQVWKSAAGAQGDMLMNVAYANGVNASTSGSYTQYIAAGGTFVGVGGVNTTGNILTSNSVMVQTECGSCGFYLRNNPVTTNYGYWLRDGRMYQSGWFQSDAKINAKSYDLNGSAMVDVNGTFVSAGGYSSNGNLIILDGGGAMLHRNSSGEWWQSPDGATSYAHINGTGYFYAAAYQIWPSQTQVINTSGWYNGPGVDTAGPVYLRNNSVTLFSDNAAYGFYVNNAANTVTNSYMNGSLAYTQTYYAGSAGAVINSVGTFVGTGGVSTTGAIMARSSPNGVISVTNGAWLSYQQSDGSMQASGDIVTPLHIGTSGVYSDVYNDRAGNPVVDSSRRFVGSGGVSTTGYIYSTVDILSRGGQMGTQDAAVTQNRAIMWNDGHLDTISTITTGTGYQTGSSPGITQDSFFAEGSRWWILGGIIYAKTALTQEDAAEQARLAANPPHQNVAVALQQTPLGGPVVPIPGPTTPPTVTPPPPVVVPPNPVAPPIVFPTLPPQVPAPTTVVPPPFVAPTAPIGAPLPPIVDEPKAAPLPAPAKPPGDDMSDKTAPPPAPAPVKPVVPTIPPRATPTKPEPLTLPTPTLGTPPVFQAPTTTTPATIGPAPTVPKPVPPYVPPPIPPLDKPASPTDRPLARLLRQVFNVVAKR